MEGSVIEPVSRLLANGNISREEIVSQFRKMHRCLQSAFVGGVIMPLLKALAEDYERSNYDDRNVNALKTCAFLWDAFKTETGVDTPCLM